MKEQYDRYLVRILGLLLFLSGVSLTDSASASQSVGLHLSFGSIIFMIIGLIMIGISFIYE